MMTLDKTIMNSFWTVLAFVLRHWPSVHKRHCLLSLHRSMIFTRGERRLPGWDWNRIGFKMSIRENKVFQARHNTFHQCQAVVHNYGPLLFKLPKVLCQTLEPLLLNFSHFSSALQVIIRPLARSSAGSRVPVSSLLTMVTHQHLRRVPGAMSKGTLHNLHSSTGATWC